LAKGRGKDLDGGMEMLEQDFLVRTVEKTKGGDYDDEDDTCYAIEENAADATSEDWANPGSNSSS